MDACALLDEELGTSKELKEAKLQAIDRLLWGFKSKQASAAGKGEG